MVKLNAGLPDWLDLKRNAVITSGFFYLEDKMKIGAGHEPKSGKTVLCTCTISTAAVMVDY